MDNSYTWGIPTSTLASSSAVPTFHTTPTATKRPRNPAEDQLEREQRLSKRFGLLQLEAQRNGSEGLTPAYSTPASTLPLTDLTQPTPSLESHQPQDPQYTAESKPSVRSDPNAGSDSDIEIDDTPTRIHISSLPHEIASIEADEAAEKEQEAHQTRYYFLPDVERRIAGLPRRLLRTDQEREIQEHIDDAERRGQKPYIEGLGLLPTKENALVLFSQTPANASALPSPPAAEPQKQSRPLSRLPLTSSSVITLAGYGHGDGDYGDDDVEVVTDNEDDDDGAMEID